MDDRSVTVTRILLILALAVLLAIPLVALWHAFGPGAHAPAKV